MKEIYKINILLQKYFGGKIATFSLRPYSLFVILGKNALKIGGKIA